MIKGYKKYSQLFDQYMNSDEKVYGKNISQAEGDMQDHLPDIVIDECISDCTSYGRIWTNTSINHRIVYHCKLYVHATQENRLGALVSAKNTNRMVKPEDNRFVLHKASVKW
jgi:hypothetical protein